MHYHVCFDKVPIISCTHVKVSTIITQVFEDEMEENEEDDDFESSAVNTIEKKLDIIGAGSILNDMAILTGQEFYANYVRCETDVQVGNSNY